MTLFGIYIHGRLKTVAERKEAAEKYLAVAGCDGMNDGRCADWQDDGHKCNEIRELKTVDEALL